MTKHGFGITLTASLKHAALFAAARRLGSQKALAIYLSVDENELGRWINLKGCPPIDEFSLARSPRWNALRLAELEKKLYDLTGQTLDDLFPRELRQSADFYKADKRIEKTKEILLHRLIGPQVSSALPSPLEAASNSELRDVLERALDGLSNVERRIVELRYGINCDRAYTLEETSRQVCRTRERIRQIEATAFRRMRLGPLGETLLHVTDLPPRPSIGQ